MAANANQVTHFKSLRIYMGSDQGSINTLRRVSSLLRTCSRRHLNEAHSKEQDREADESSLGGFKTDDGPGEVLVTPHLSLEFTAPEVAKKPKKKKKKKKNRKKKKSGACDPPPAAPELPPPTVGDTDLYSIASDTVTISVQSNPTSCNGGAYDKLGTIFPVWSDTPTLTLILPPATPIAKHDFKELQTIKIKIDFDKFRAAKGDLKQVKVLLREGVSLTKDLMLLLHLPFEVVFR